MRAFGKDFARLVGPARAADLRRNVSSIWRRLFAAVGRYRPMPLMETEVLFQDRCAFKGDPPVQILDGAHEQGRMAFRRPRPAFEEAADLVVTPSGGAWREGCFEERFSAGRPGLRRLMENRRPVEMTAEAVVIQSAHNDTYGDWVSEYLVPVLRTSPLSAPLLLPKAIAAKPFTSRDLAALGIEWRAIDRPIRIAKARVLRQQKFFVHFTVEEARLLRGFFGEAAAPARAGGLVYLSRFGEVSDVADRRYPNSAVEKFVKSRGGCVIRTATAAREDYEAAAKHAETVIFDHGSAFYNTIGWPVRRVVELVADAWWNNAFLMLADAAGTRDYTIIRVDLGEAHVQRLLEQTLAAPLDGGAPS